MCRPGSRRIYPGLFIKGEDIWQPHMKEKMNLIKYVHEHTDARFNPEILTVGFARRAASYKRSDLIFRDTRVIDSLLKKRKSSWFFGKSAPG